MTTDIRTRLAKEDTVQVISGRSSGHQGRVLDVDRRKGRILVEGAMMVKKHVKPNPQKQVKGGIADSESYFSISNVMIVCPQCGPVRIGMHVDDDGSKLRVCRKCGQTLEKKKAN
jgi:large subunit ribosomal protein L24